MKRSPLYTYTIIAFLWAALALPSLAQKPTWTTYSQRKASYPESQYLLGFSSEENTGSLSEDELLQRNLSYAKTQLIETVKVNINSITTLNISNMNAQTLEDFKQSSVSYSAMDISGLQTETYYDKKKKIAYAIAYAHKPTVITTYQTTISQQLKSIEHLIKEGNNFEASADLEDALKKYYATMPIFREIEEAQTLLIAMGGKVSTEFDQSTQQLHDYQTTVDKAIKNIQQQSHLNMDEVAFYMAAGFKTQIGKAVPSVKLFNFTYQDTEMASPFSARWGKTFEQKLIQEAQFEIIETSIHSETPQYKHFITGTYWKDGDNLKLIAILRNTRTGKAIASMEGKLPILSLEKKQIRYEPNQLEDALDEQKVFAQDEEVNNDGLVTQLWTNKGDNKLIYTEGERLKIYVKVNRPCYLRFIYHLANHERVLLMDNFYMSPDKVNQVYELPDEFECAAPFGIETLQFNAQTTQFTPLITYEEGGYDIITSSLEEVVAKTRGFKKVKDKVLASEKRIILTTIPRR